MKARPRSVERRVAEELSTYFTSIGLSEIQRIAVLGKTGPDLTTNEAKLVIDVKSRKSIPLSMLAPKGVAIEAGPLIGFQISDIGNPITLRRQVRCSKTVLDWIDWMDEWTQKYCPEGISAIILHRPRLDIVRSTVIIYSKELPAWQHRTQHSQ